MPSWNGAEYVRRATDIAREFATLKKPLNDLCEKVARDEAMNPDEIRTLVRLSNVAAFQQLFKDREGDKMVEFDVGNPESVIQRIQSAVDSPMESANIHNDKLAFEIPDQMKEIRLGRKFDEQVKVAHEDYVERAPRKDLVIIAMRKLASEFEIERRMAGNKWEYELNKLAREFRKAPGYGPNFREFEKDAYAEFGQDIYPEMHTLYSDLRLTSERPSAEKVASLQEHHVTTTTPELERLKVAVEARTAFQKFTKGLEWLKANTPTI